MTGGDPAKLEVPTQAGSSAPSRGNSAAERLSWIEEDVLKDLNALKLERIAAGHEVLDLAMINPDIAPGRFLLDKLLEATVRPANHRYAVARGVRKLRDAFAEKYRSRWGVALDPESEVCVTMGSKDAIEHALMGIASEGDTVLVGAPTYPTYLSAIRLAKLVPAFFEVVDDEGRMLAEIEARCAESGPKVLVLNFPNNPTGITVTKSFYERLSLIADRFGLFVINDFVYGEMQFGAEGAVSLLSVPSLKARAAEIYSLSKAYSIPGWRVGALVGNGSAVKMLSLLKAHIDYGIFLPIQHAAAAALAQGGSIPAGIAAQYQERCGVLCDGLSKLGWEPVAPRAGCCVWAKLPARLREEGALSVTRRLLADTGIVALPGAAFGGGFDHTGGPLRFEEWVRFALVLPLPRVRGVLDKIGMWSRGPAQPLPSGVDSEVGQQA